MVTLNPELAARTKVYQDRLLVPSTGSEMFPLPANERALQGFDPSVATVNELAYVPPEVWESVTGATGKRDQSLVWAISTPPLNDTSVMHQLVKCQHRRDIEPGSPVVLAFDGSRNGDSTVLVAVTIEQVPHVQPVAAWSSEGKPEGWQVPRARGGPGDHRGP